MIDLYLRRIGFVNPTIVERVNEEGKIERLESRGLDIASVVAFWRKCFGMSLYEILFEKITLHCTSKDYNAMNQRNTVQSKNVKELFAENDVELVVDDEWFKDHEIKNEEAEQANRILANACNKFSERTEKYERQIKQLRIENKELRKTISENGNEIYSFSEKDLQTRIEKERETAVFNFIKRIRFDLGRLYGIDSQLNEITLADVMEDIRNIYKEVYKK